MKIKSPGSLAHSSVCISEPCPSDALRHANIRLQQVIELQNVARKQIAHVIIAGPTFGPQNETRIFWLKTT
jgi:hypothetical protein